MLQRKDGSTTNTELAGKVDWNQMLENQRNYRKEQWEKWEKALAFAGKDVRWYFDSFKPRWKIVIDTKDQNAENAMREEWRLIRKAVADQDHDLMWDVDLEHRGTTKEEHINADSGLTFAFLDLEGKWNERGNMGWFAIVTDKNADYDNLFWQFVKTIPDNQRVYIVDAHI